MRLIKLFLVVCIIILPVSALAKKAKTIEELAAMYDSSSCKECHAEIYGQWEKSHHARSLMGVLGGLFMTPLAMKGKTPFSPDDPSKATIATFPCFKCHLPQAVVSADDAFAVDYAKALLAQDKKRLGQLRITCIVCHNTKAIIHKRSEGHPEPNVLYGSKEVAAHEDARFKKVKKSSIMDHAIMCGQCHGMGPNLEFENPVQCATLYGSYQHNYLPKGGQKSCQECHMKKVDGFADHLIAPNWNDLDGTKKLLQDAISLDIDTVGYDWLLKSKDHKPMVVVNTRINQNAGHRIPDGWPSHNRVVLEVTAKSADGKEVYNKERHYHPQATDCRTNKMLYGAQVKTQYIRDTSLQPMETKDESFEIMLPTGVRTVDVTVSLRYEIWKPSHMIEIHRIDKKVSLDR